MNESPQRRFINGRGVRLFDDSGNQFLDAVSGTFNLPLGYDHPKVVKAIQDQVAEATHISSHMTPLGTEELINRLVANAPNPIATGRLRDACASTANEGAIKLAQYYTDRTDVISLFHSHHGQSAFTTAISGRSSRRKNSPSALSSHSVRVPTPYCHRCFYGATYPECGLLCVDRIRQFITYCSSGNVACMIVEPVLGCGGNIVPPDGYFSELRRLADEKEILLIADEVQTGFGRTGFMFASETLGLVPDMVTIGKGLGGIGLPIAGFLMRSELKVPDSVHHSFTGGGNLAAVAAALAALEVIEQPEFLAEVRRKGELLGEMLHGLRKRHCCIGDVRGLGLMWGIEIEKPDGLPDVELTNSIVKVAFSSKNLILRSSEYGEGNVIKIRPALIVSDEELEEIVSKLDSTICELRPVGHRC